MCCVFSVVCCVALCRFVSFCVLSCRVVLRCVVLCCVVLSAPPNYLECLLAPYNICGRRNERMVYVVEDARIRRRRNDATTTAAPLIHCNADAASYV